MSVVGKALIESTVLTTTATDTSYTATNVRTRIDKCTAANKGASAVLLTVYLIASGGSAGVTNEVIHQRSVASGETYTCPEVVGQWLNPGDKIQAKDDAGSSTDFRVSGVEVSGT